MRYLILLVVISYSVQASYFDRKAEGWHWYEKQHVDETSKEEKPASEALKESSSDPSKVLEGFKKEMERRLHLAVVSPSYANVKSYMQIQQAMMERSEIFAKRWMEVLYTNPALDYTVKHPTTQAARHVYLDQQKHEMDQKIRRLSKTHGLFFFFKSGCEYCHQFAPVVKKFSQKYGWTVLAISIDGHQLPEFPNAQLDNGAADKLNVTSVPSLLAVEPTTGQIIPLSYGMSSEDQIEDRVRVLVQEGGIRR